MLRKVLTGVLAAGVVALVLGAVTRALMRLVAVAAGHDGSFTWSGTAGIVLVFFVVALPGCLVAATTRFRWTLLVAGALFLCVPATGVASEELGATGSFGAARWAGVGLATLAIYGAVLAMPVLALRVVDAAAPRPRVPAPRTSLEGTRGTPAGRGGRLPPRRRRDRRTTAAR